MLTTQLHASNRGALPDVPCAPSLPVWLQLTCDLLISSPETYGCRSDDAITNRSQNLGEQTYALTSLQYVQLFVDTTDEEDTRDDSL